MTRVPGFSSYNPPNPPFLEPIWRIIKLIPHVQNKFVCIFLTQTIISQKDKYGYGLKMGTARLRRQKIMLPVNESGSPDYSFMENYMKVVESKLLLKYIEQKLS